MAELFRLLAVLSFFAGAGADAVPPAEPRDGASFSARPEELRQAADAAGGRRDANAVVLLEEATYSFDDAGAPPCRRSSRVRWWRKRSW